MASLTNWNVFRHIVSTNFLASLRLRQYRRFALLTLGISIILSTLYYSHLKPSGVSFSQDLLFWPPETPEIWASRAAQVKEAFRHAYHGYEQHAFPHDELMPVSNQSSDK